MDRIFAKPFISAFPHPDAITALATNPKRLNCLISGTVDGYVFQWDVANNRCLRRFVGHSNTIKGIAVSPDGESCISCSSDCSIKLWKIPVAPFEEGQATKDCGSVMDFPGTESYQCLDHHWEQQIFAAGSAVVEIWDASRAKPIHRFSWGP